MTSTNQGTHQRPTPDDQPPAYLGGPLEGLDAEPGRTTVWNLYRGEDGRQITASTGDRHVGLWLRGLPHREVYVLQRSARTGHWCYVALPFLPAFLAANLHAAEEEGAPAGPGPRGDVPEPRAHDAADGAGDLRSARERAVRRAAFGQLSESPSDRGSDGIDPHRAAADVLARWGAGGLLAEVQQLTAHHEAELPAELEALVAPLAMALAAYAPAASLSGDLAWRKDPCTPCAGEARVLGRLAALDEVRADD